MGVFRCDIQVRVLDRLGCRSNAVVYERVHLAGFFGGKVLAYIKVFDQPSKPDGERGHIEAGNGGYAALAGKDIIPRGADTITDGRDNT